MKSRLASDSLTENVRASSKRIRNTSTALVASVTSKIEDDKIKAALWMLCSDDKPAADSETIIATLKERHFPAAHDRHPSSAPRNFAELPLTEAEINAVINPCPASSAGEPDGIRPQHILYLASNKEMDPTLVTSQTNFANMLLTGRWSFQLFLGSVSLPRKKSPVA